MPGLSDYERWTPDAQSRALELLKETERQDWRPFYCLIPRCDGHPHFDYDHRKDCEYAEANGCHRWVKATVWSCSECGVVGKPKDEWEWEHARADQRPPRWNLDWLTLWFSGGRGSGKTRTGSEIVHRATAVTSRIIMVASTGPDFRDTMVEGVSGILACSKPGNRPEWEPSKKKLTWPNGCIGQGFSAEEPDRLRGPQSGLIWGDEPAHWDRLKDCWDNMTFGLRMGEHPHIFSTSTPLPTKPVKEIMAEDDTIVRRVSTYANMVNLSPKFRQKVIKKYEGTRLGEQELHGRVLDDVEGALWNWDMIRRGRPPVDLIRVVVGVDPAGTANKRSDETGIIVVALTLDDHIWVLDDTSGKYSPAGWGKRANKAYEHWSADAIVPEKNYGADMVTFVLQNSGYKGARIKPVQSRRGKEIRAEPVVALYEKRMVHHVDGLTDLEDELTTWVPGEGASPNRLDALVHAITAVARHLSPAEIASPTSLPRWHEQMRTVLGA